MIDPGVGTNRAALAFGAHAHWFVGPDNGVFTPVLKDAEVDAVVSPRRRPPRRRFMGEISLHLPPQHWSTERRSTRLGQQFEGIPERLAYTLPHFEGKTVVGEIVYIDRVRQPGHQPDHRAGAHLCQARNRRPRSRSTEAHLQRCDIGRLAGLHRLWWRHEIAVRNGSAARRLGVGVGGRVRARLG